MNLNSIYTPKQIEILKACRNTDWFMLPNHGAKCSGKTQLDNDVKKIKKNGNWIWLKISSGWIFICHLRRFFWPNHLF